MTTVTLNVAIVRPPIRASTATPAPGPTARKIAISGVSVASENTKMGRVPTRSARRPPISVPSAPATSIAASARLPVAFEVCSVPT